jgi:2-polyprenyl-3-methyl-5-hydroxy-6-metoxy-1,4-benzoquinol methylase
MEVRVGLEQTTKARKAISEMIDLDWARGLTDDEWCAFLAGELNVPGRSPPPLPLPEFQRSWVGEAGLIALTEAKTFLRHMKAGMAEAGVRLRRDMRVLDFGAGWGRFYRLLMRDVDQLIGADPDEPCIKMCREMLPGRIHPDYDKTSL